MTPEGSPTAAFFDPGAGHLPPTLDLVFADPDTSALLLVAAADDQRAPAGAMALAEARAASGRETILADADLDAPALHGLLDVENLEGLVDVFLFGASLRRVAVRPRGRGFLFIPAGPYAPDPAEVLGSPRWNRITEELEGSDTLLLVFCRAGAAGLAELSRRVGRAVILGDERKAARVAQRLDPACHVLATVRVGEAPAEGAREVEGTTAAAAPAAAERDGVGRDERAEDPGPERPADRRHDDESEEGSSADPLTEPMVVREEPEERRVSPVLLGLLVLALIAAGWFAYQQFFVTEPPRTAAPTEPAVTTPVAADPGDPIETPLPYSVAVEAHQSLETAQQRASTLREAEPGMQFYLAPVSVNGDRFYRLLAGPAPDEEAANALMQRLVDAGHKTAMDAWAIRPTSHAFLLGEFDDRDEASERVDSLAAAGVPAYPVPLRYEGGQVAYRVYAGAFASETEAEVMRVLLEDAGIEAPLVTRTGEAGA